MVFMILKLLLIVCVTETVKGSCDEELFGESGILTSPNWPGLYPLNIVCTYQITVPAEKVVRLDISNASIQASEGCIYDSVKIFDSNGQIANICGQTTGIYFSSDNQMNITFASDTIINDLGFYAEYLAVFNPEVLPQTTEAAYNCDQILTGEIGNFTSPNWPENYPINIACRYEITVPEGKVVKLEFITFSVEWATGCVYDSVQLFTGYGETGKICGSVPGVYYSNTNQMNVTFISDIAYADQGFYAVYSAVLYQETTTTNNGNNGAVDVPNIGISQPQNDCPEDIVASSGQVTSPNYPGSYPPNKICETKVTVPEGMNILISFTSFQIEPAADCAYDSVTVFDAFQIHGVFCGFTTPPILISRTNLVKIHFSSDSIENFAGFSLDFYAVENNTSIEEAADYLDSLNSSAIDETTKTTPTTSPNLTNDSKLESVTDDLMTIILVTFGVILVIGVVALVSGLLFCKYTKDNVKNLKKSKKKRKTIKVKELPVWPTLKKIPPSSTQFVEPGEKLHKQIDLTVIDA